MGYVQQQKGKGTQCRQHNDCTCAILYTVISIFSYCFKYYYDYFETRNSYLDGIHCGKQAACTQEDPNQALSSSTTKAACPSAGPALTAPS
jgi:hypothetical protein